MTIKYRRDAYNPKSGKTITTISEFDEGHFADKISPSAKTIVRYYTLVNEWNRLAAISKKNNGLFYRYTLIH
jgi:hypothetical protein